MGLPTIGIERYDDCMVAPTNIAVETSGPDLSRLVESARQGREVVITQAGQPIAKIIPIPAPQGRPKAGYGKGTVVQMTSDFDEPLSDFDEEP